MDGQTTNGGETKKIGHGLHWHCCLMPMLTTVAWIVAVVSAVYAWVQLRGGMDATGWYWNALVFAVLALFGKGKKMGACRGHGDCHCGSATCPVCSHKC